MGLDMYLYRKTYIGARYEHRKAALVIEGVADGKKLNIDPTKVSGITELVACWRKANQIHKWFVDNTQDGEDRNGASEVSKEQLLSLLETCRKVISIAKLKKGSIHTSTTWSKGNEAKTFEDGMVIENAEEVAALLPSQKGFFFGSTEYDEYYLKDVEETITALETLDLTNKDYNVSYEYCASW